jgi:hypothetical protein
VNPERSRRATVPSGHARRICSESSVEAVEPDDVRVFFEVLFDIRKDTRRVLWILEGDDDEEEEEDA